MGGRRPWKDTETLPSHLVPKDMLADGSYRPSGFQCWSCPWRTNKVGYGGRQSIRAHSRVHAYDRKAWQRPLAIITALAILAVSLAIVGRLGLIRLDPLTRIQASDGIRLGAFALPVLLAVVGVIIYTTADSASPAVLWTIRGVVVACLLPAVAVLAVTVGVVEMELGRVEMVLAVLSWAFAAAFACGAGYVRRLLRRRMREPSGYTDLASAKDENAESHLRWRISEARRATAKRSDKSQPPRPKEEKTTRRTPAARQDVDLPGTGAEPEA